jgi:hypothetical protein
LGGEDAEALITLGDRGDAGEVVGISWLIRLHLAD